jgi:hypothetical protein
LELAGYLVMRTPAESRRTALWPWAGATNPTIANSMQLDLIIETSAWRE